MPWLNVGSCVVSSQCYNFSARSFIHSFALNHFHVQNSRVFMFFANFHLILDKLNSTKWMMITFKKKKCGGIHLANGNSVLNMSECLFLISSSAAQQTNWRKMTAIDGKASFNIECICHRVNIHRQKESSTLSVSVQHFWFSPLGFFSQSVEYHVCWLVFDIVLVRLHLSQVVRDDLFAM